MRPRDLIVTTPEKPVAGGAMLARVEGAIVLLEGAIPGEQVEARITQVKKQTAWAQVTRVLDPSPDRVEPFCDPSCGGMRYLHIHPERQLALKREVVQDAFARIAKQPITSEIPAFSADAGAWRIRVRLHAHRDRLGFYREGTHSVCDARATRQISEALMGAAEWTFETFRRADVAVESLELTETVDGSARACHAICAAETETLPAFSDPLPPGLSGISAARGEQGTTEQLCGVSVVTDALSLDASAPDRQIRLDRHVRSFFQGNRHLIERFTSHVIAQVPPGDAVDLYAGVGLFAVALAARGDTTVTAVEGDELAFADLSRNAQAFDGRLHVVQAAVEDWTTEDEARRADTLIVDPPRTGLSPEALRVVLARRAARIVYVSCDPATLARDARWLFDSSYALAGIELFDLFPHTAHIETVAVFNRR